VSKQYREKAIADVVNNLERFSGQLEFLEISYDNTNDNVIGDLPSQLSTAELMRTACPSIDSVKLTEHVLWEYAENDWVPCFSEESIRVLGRAETIIDWNGYAAEFLEEEGQAVIETRLTLEGFTELHLKS